MRKQPLIAIALGLRERRDLAARKDGRRGEGDWYRVFHGLRINLPNSLEATRHHFFVQALFILWPLKRQFDEHFKNERRNA